jgi:hypothetical protein
MAGRIGYYGGIVLDSLVLNLDSAKFDSYIKTGSTWLDISGQNNIATLINSPVYTSESGGLFTFDGIDEHARIPPASVFRNLTNATFSVWCRFSTLAKEDYLTTLAHSTESGNNFFWFFYDNIPASIHYRRFWIGWGNGTTRNYFRSSVFPLTVNTWYNTTWTFDNGNYVIYVNGVQVGSGSGLTSIAGSTIESVFLGGYRSAVSPGVQFTFPGNINQYLIYRKTLTQSQVLQNYNATRIRYGV